MPAGRDGSAAPAERGDAPAPLVARIWGLAIESLNSVGTVWILALMFLVCADVVARSFLGNPIDGVAEIAAVSVVGIVFLQIAAAARNGRMMRADYLIGVLNRRWPAAAHLLEAFYWLVATAVFALLVKVTWPQLLTSIQRGEFFGVEGMFTMPVWPLRLLILVGAACTAAVSLVAVVTHVRGALRGTD
jgi:TRAP-type mannitol/chloroaromatic compound transport system permease small subunit